MNCPHCQSLLLDHLYGLLEGPEAVAVDAHLAACADCTAARAETAHVQGLIAQAAKGAFPQVKFEPPAPTKAGTRTPAPGTARTLPFPTATPQSTTRDRGRSLRVAAFLPWAVAAAVLLAIPGTVVPVLGIFKGARNAAQEAETARRAADNADAAADTAFHARQTQLSGAQFRLAAAEQAQTALFNQWVDDQKAALQHSYAPRLTVNVFKPANVQPGAPNDFLVAVYDTRDGWESRGKKLVAEIRTGDATDAVLYTQTLDYQKGRDKHHIRLPADVWAKVKPDAELYLVLAQIDEARNTRTELPDRVRLAGPVYATLLVTDKPVYRPGERLFFRSLTLDRVTFRPPAREQSLRFDLVRTDGMPVDGLSVMGTTDTVRLGAGGAVNPVRTTDGQPVRGVGCGEFVLPPDLPDGDYLIRVSEVPPADGSAPAITQPVLRAVKVRSGAADRYQKLIGFTRASYASGDDVEAWAELKFQGVPLKGAEVAAVTAEADGEPINGAKALAGITDEAGRIRIRLVLPPDVMRGDVRLKVTFRTPHGEESVADRVPVVSRQLNVEFFPESGDALIAGVPCKVYVRATTPAGQPVEIRGVVTDGRDVLARVETLHDDNEPGANRGLAAFTFTPRLGVPMWLKLESPAGVYAPILTDVVIPNASVAGLGGPGAVAVRTGFALPPARASGVVMSVPDVVTGPGEPIRVYLYSVGRPRTIVVGAYIRGRLADTREVTVEPGAQPTVVPLLKDVDARTANRGGVVRITAFEKPEEAPDEPKKPLEPVAERLVFRKPGEVLNLSFGVVPAEPGAAPVGQRGAFPAGAGVKLDIRATTEKGRPTAAVAWAAVVNSGVAPGPKDRLLPTHFLLSGEVKTPDDLEYADFLLTDHPRAAEALDLVLGTQGWRRFIEQGPPDGKRPVYIPLAPDPDIGRVMAQNGQLVALAEPPTVQAHRELAQKYAPVYEAAVRAVKEAEAARDATLQDQSTTAEARRLSTIAAANRHVADHRAELAGAAREPVRRFRAVVWYGIGGLGAFALLCLGLALGRPLARLPLSVSTLGSLGLAAFLVVAAGWPDPVSAAASVPATTRESVAVAPMPHEKGDSVPEHGFHGPVLGMDAKGGGKSTADGTGTPGKPSRPLVYAGPRLTSGYGGAVYPYWPKESKVERGGPGVEAPGGGMSVPGTPGATMIEPPMIVPPAAPTMLPVRPDAPPTPLRPSLPGGMGFAPQPPNIRSGIDSDRDPVAKYTFGGREPDVVGAKQRADELRRASMKANEYASERAAVLAASMDPIIRQRFQQRVPVPTPNPTPLPPNAQTVPPAMIEVLAVEQVRVTVAATAIPPLVLREYAAPRPAPAGLPDSPETPDTILWQPLILLSSDGAAVIPFHLGNAPGGYQVIVAGHAPDGRLGATRGNVLVLPTQTMPMVAPAGPDAPAGSIPPTAPIVPGPTPKP